MNKKQITTWIAIAVIALAQFYTMVEPAVTFAGGAMGHGGG